MEPTDGGAELLAPIFDLVVAGGSSFIYSPLAPPLPLAPPPSIELAEICGVLADLITILSPEFPIVGVDPGSIPYSSLISFLKAIATALLSANLDSDLFLYLSVLTFSSIGKQV